MEMLTAVTVSMHKTNGSEVRYRLSEKAYSFPQLPKQILSWAHSCMIERKVPFKEQVNCARYFLYQCTLFDLPHASFSPSLSASIHCRCNSAFAPLDEARHRVSRREIRTQNEPPYRCLLPCWQFSVHLVHDADSSSQYQPTTALRTCSTTSGQTIRSQCRRRFRLRVGSRNGW